MTVGTAAAIASGAPTVAPAATVAAAARLASKPFRFDSASTSVLVLLMGHLCVRPSANARRHLARGAGRKNCRE
jgi:hypothetical protein